MSGCLVMLVYFVLIYALMWKLPILQNLELLMRRRALIVISLLYCIALYMLICLLEGMKIGQRRILDLIFGFFFQFALHQCGSSLDRTRISGQFMEKAPVMCDHFDSYTKCDRFQMDHLVPQDL